MGESEWSADLLPPNVAEELKLHELVAKAIFLGEHPGATWSAGRARAVWFTRAQDAIAAYRSVFPPPLTQDTSNG